MRRQVDWASWRRSSLRSFRSPSRYRCSRRPATTAGAFWTEFDLGSAPDSSCSSSAPRCSRPHVSRPGSASASPRSCSALRSSCSCVVRGSRRSRWVPRSASFSFRSSVSSSESSLRVPTSSATCSRRHRAGAPDAARPPPGRRRPLERGGRRRCWSCTLWFGVLFQYWHRDIGVDIDRRERLVAFLEEHAPSNGMPVAVAHPHDYLELAHHAPSSLAGRLVRLSDPERALRYTGSRSTEDGLVVLADFAPLRSFRTTSSGRRSSCCAPCAAKRVTGSIRRSPTTAPGPRVIAQRRGRRVHARAGRARAPMSYER